MDGSCDMSKEEGGRQTASHGRENEHNELNSPTADKDDVMDNNKRLIHDAGADDSEEVKDSEAGCARTKQRVYKNGVIMCSFENVGRKRGHTENMTLTERDDEVATAPGHLSLAEMAVSESAGDVNKPRCLNENVISNNQDGLCLGDVLDNTPNVESSEIEGQNSNILGTNLIGMNGGQNDSSFLVPSSTDENICADVNVLKMTCNNVCPLKKESLKQESGQQGGIEDSCTNESPPLVHYTSTDEAKNSSGNSCQILKSTCNNSDYLVDREATSSDGNYLIDKETLKQEKNPENDVEAPCNDNVHPVDTDSYNVHPVDTDSTCNDNVHAVDTDSYNVHPVDTDSTCNDNVHPVDTDSTCNDNVHPVDTDSTCNDNVCPVDTDSTCNDNVCPVDTDSTCNDNVHPMDTDSTCNDNVHPVDTDSTCNDNVHPVDTDSTCNDNVHPMDTDSTCNDNVHPVDTDSTCNDNVHPVDTDSTCNDNVHSVDTDSTCNDNVCPVDTGSTCNDNVHPVDTDSTCNDNVHPVDTDSTCNDNVHPVDTDSTCNDNVHPMDTDPTCNDNVHPVDTDSTCNDNVHPMDSKTFKRENDEIGGVGDNCINESLPLVPLTTNDNAKDSACAAVHVSQATSNGHDCDVGKESSKQDSGEQSGLQVNIDESLSLDLSATNENVGNISLQINAEIDGSPSLDISTSNDKTKNFSLQINAEIDGSPSLDLSPSNEKTKNFSGYESDVSEVTFDNNVCEAVKETSSQEMDQENGVKTLTCISMSSPLVHLDKDEHGQTLASDENDIPKATFNDSVSFVKDGTSRLTNDQQNDCCMSSSPVPLDTDTISETLKCGESSISKDTICGMSLPVHEASLRVQEMLNRGVHKTNSDLQSSIFMRCEHSSSLDKDVNFKKQHGVETNQKVVIELVQENCSADIEVDMSGSPVTVDRTASSESLAEDLSETLMTVNKTARCGSVEVAITESQIRLSKTVQSTTVEVDAPELLKTVNKMAHSDSLGEEVLESSITTSKTVQSTTVEMDVSELVKTVNKMAHSDSLGGEILESSVTTSKTVQSTTTEVDVPELVKIVSKTVHSESLGEDILRSSITTSKTVQRPTTPEVDVPELVKTVSKTVHSESVGEDIPELMTAISKTAPFGSIDEDIDGTVQIVDMTADSDSLEENVSDSHKIFHQTALGEDVEGDICRSLKNKKAMSKKKKRTKEKKGHRKKSKKKQESEKVAETLRLVEVSRDVYSAEGVRMEEVAAEGRSVIYNRLCDERMSVNTYEELLDQEIENQEMRGLREPGEIEFIKERKKKGKKKKKKKRRRVATVEEGDVGDNAWQQFPTYLDGFFLQYDEGNEELDETVGDASVSSDNHARMLHTEERIYPRHFSFESEDSGKSGHCSDSAQNRCEELERRRRKKHDKREHKERKRKRERSNSHEGRHEREHFVTLSARSNSHEAQHEREHFVTARSNSHEGRHERENFVTARSNSHEAQHEREHFITLTARRQHMFDRERIISAREEERVRSSNRKIRHIDRERDREKVMPDKDRRRVEVDEERRRSARSSSQDYRTVIAERSPVHSSQHRQRSESRGVANDMEQERGWGRAQPHDKNDTGRKSHKRDRNAENSCVESLQHRSERGSDKENNRRHKRRRQIRTHETNDSDSRGRIRNARRVHVRGASVSSSSSVSNQGVVRHRGDDSDDDQCIIISQGNSDDEGASSDVILVESERIVINLDDDEDAPPSRVNITRGGRNPPANTRKTNRKSVRPPSELSASVSHSVQISEGPKRLENVRDKSARQVLRAAPASDRCSIEVETLSVVTSSSAYDPMHPTEEADDCNFTHPAFSSSRIPSSPLVERRPVSPDSPAPKEGRPSTPPLPIVVKAGATASLLPSQPSVGDASSNPTSAPAFLTHTQSQQQALMPLPSHLGCELEQASIFPNRSLRSSLSPNKQLPNSGLTPGFPAVQQSLFLAQDTVQLLPLQNSTRLPLPFNSMIPPFLPPPPPPPFGVCLEVAQRLPVPTLNQFSQLVSTQPSLEVYQLQPVSPVNQFSQLASSQPSFEASHLVPVSPVNQFSQLASTRSNVEASQYLPVSPMNRFTHLASTQPSLEASQHLSISPMNRFTQLASTPPCLEASQHLPVPPMNQFSQLACTQPVMERHHIDSYRDNQDMFQPFDMFSSLQTNVCIQPTHTDKSPPVGSLAADLSSSCSHSSQGQDCGDIMETTKATDMDFSSGDDDYHLELLSPKANRKDSKRGRKQRQHSNLNQGASSGNSGNPGSSSELSVKHGKTLRKDANKVAPKEHLQVSQDRSKVHRGKKKRVENKVRDEENDDDVPASAADLTCKEKFLKKLFFQERVIEEVKMAVKPFYNSKKITKEQYKVILRKAVPKVCHNKKGNINPQKILHLVEAYVRKMKGQGRTGGKKRPQVQPHRAVEKHNPKDKNVSASVKHNGDRTFGLVR